MKLLQGKVAIVTGSSRGIGAEIARTLAGAGAKVIINYLTRQKEAELTRDLIKAAGGEALAIQSDVRNSSEIHKLFDETIKNYGQVDILINNAGVLLYKKIADISDEEFDQTLSSNVKGVFYALREAAIHLRNDGRVVTLSSTVTRMLLPKYGAYAASKGAVEQITRVFAREMGERGITANIVSPGPVNTELFTSGKSKEDIKRIAAMSVLNRVGEPKDISEVVLFLVSPESGWITGQNISASGGIA
ncbi:MAG: SDR family oxidoreductase [Nitrosomonadaceae bacterium]|nr:SDR family oxidoreductase [Nitrosomonadaceae bacterium]